MAMVIEMIWEKLHSFLIIKKKTEKRRGFAKSLPIKKNSSLSIIYFLFFYFNFILQYYVYCGVGFKIDLIYFL